MVKYFAKNITKDMNTKKNFCGFKYITEKILTL